MTLPTNDPSGFHDAPNFGAASKVDPDPFIVASLILSAVATASGVYSALATHVSSRSDKRRQEIEQSAAILRWEADLHELRPLLEDVGEFLSELGFLGSGNIPQPLKPFTAQLELDDQQLELFRRLLGRIIQKTQQLNNSSFKLLGSLDQKAVQSHLADNVGVLQEHLLLLQRMESLEVSIDSALNTVDMLLKTAEYLRNELI